jgi:hypothetical protein
MIIERRGCGQPLRFFRGTDAASKRCRGHVRARGEGPSTSASSGQSQRLFAPSGDDAVRRLMVFELRDGATVGRRLDVDRFLAPQPGDP